jgi:hypothetical protein
VRWWIVAAACSTPAPAPVVTAAKCSPLCVPEPDGTCNRHSVSPCQWVLGAPNDPVDIVLPCAASCCPDHDTAELCPDFPTDPTIPAQCPVRDGNGVRGSLAGWHAETLGFVLAQAHGITTSASEHSALIDREGAWTMADVPPGPVVFSFYLPGGRSRTSCRL